MEEAAQETGFFQSLGTGFAGAFNDFAKSYGTALGSRSDSFGNVKNAGVTDPAVQAQRNPLTGQLYSTKNPGSTGASGISLNSPAVLIGLAGTAVLAIVLLRR